MMTVMRSISSGISGDGDFLSKKTWHEGKLGLNLQELGRISPNHPSICTQARP